MGKSFPIKTPFLRAEAQISAWLRDIFPDLAVAVISFLVGANMFNTQVIFFSFSWINQLDGEIFS